MASTGTMNAWKVSFREERKHERLFRTKAPIPKPTPDGLLVKILAMGACHSDGLICSFPIPRADMHDEFILGHEGAGEIVEVGSQVDGAEFKVGDRVAIFPVPGCGECLQCTRGLARLCQSPHGIPNYGLGRDGTFAEFLAIKASAARKVPPGVTIEQAALSADAVLTAYYAVKYTAEVKPEQTIVLYGLGGVGFNGLQTALHLGPKQILVVDNRQIVLDAAVKLGVKPENTFNTSNKEAKTIEQYVSENGIQVDTAIDFVGKAETLGSAQMIVRPAGQVVIVGLLDMTAPLLTFPVVTLNLTIKGSYSGTPETLGEALDLIAQGVLTPSLETTSIERLPEVMKGLDDGKIKSRMVMLPEWKE